MKYILSILLVLVISVSVNAQKVLFLDAGHGGKDLGAIAPSGVSEAEINLAFVKEIKELAEAKGIKVVMLSSESEYVSLVDRSKKANEYQLAPGETGVLISIHANYSKDETKSGIEILVMRADESSEEVSELATRLKKNLNGVIIEKGLTILRNATMPAVLIEMGYLSNLQEGMDLQMPDMRTLLARKIVEAL